VTFTKPIFTKMTL